MIHHWERGAGYLGDEKYTDTQHAMYLYRVTDTQVYRQYTDTQHAMLTHKNTQNKPIPTYMRKKV